MYGGYILREIVPKESKILNKNLLKLKMRIYLHIYMLVKYIYIYIYVSESKYFECPVGFWLVTERCFDWLLKDVFDYYPQGNRVGFLLTGINNKSDSHGPISFLIKSHQR